MAQKLAVITHVERLFPYESSDTFVFALNLQTALTDKPVKDLLDLLNPWNWKALDQETTVDFWAVPNGAPSGALLLDTGQSAAIWKYPDTVPTVQNAKDELESVQGQMFAANQDTPFLWDPTDPRQPDPPQPYGYYHHLLGSVSMFSGLLAYALNLTVFVKVGRNQINPAYLDSGKFKDKLKLLAAPRFTVGTISYVADLTNGPHPVADGSSVYEWPYIAAGSTTPASAYTVPVSLDLGPADPQKPSDPMPDEFLDFNTYWVRRQLPYVDSSTIRYHPLIDPGSDDWHLRLADGIADAWDLARHLLDTGGTWAALPPTDFAALWSAILASLRDRAGMGLLPAPDGDSLATFALRRASLLSAEPQALGSMNGWLEKLRLRDRLTSRTDWQQQLADGLEEAPDTIPVQAPPQPAQFVATWTAPPGKPLKMNAVVTLTVKGPAPSGPPANTPGGKFRVTITDNQTQGSKSTGDLPVGISATDLAAKLAGFATPDPQVASGTTGYSITLDFSRYSVTASGSGGAVTSIVNLITASLQWAATPDASPWTDVGGLSNVPVPLVRVAGGQSAAFSFARVAAAVAPGWFRGNTKDTSGAPLVTTPSYVGRQITDALTPLARIASTLREDDSLAKLVGYVWKQCSTEPLALAAGVSSPRAFTAVQGPRSAVWDEAGTLALDNGDCWALTLANLTFGVPNNEGASVATWIPQVVQVAGTQGTFTLQVGTQKTSDLHYNATASDVQAALEGLTNVGAGKVGVIASPPAGNTTLFTIALATPQPAAITPIGKDGATASLLPLTGTFDFALGSVPSVAMAPPPPFLTVTGVMGGSASAGYTLALTVTGDGITATPTPYAIPNGTAHVRVQAVPAGNVLYVRVTGSTGSFTLRSDTQTTADLPVGAAATAVTAELEKFKAIGTGKVRVESTTASGNQTIYTLTAINGLQTLPSLQGQATGGAAIAVVDAVRLTVYFGRFATVPNSQYPWENVPGFAIVLPADRVAQGSVQLTHRANALNVVPRLQFALTAFSDTTLDKLPDWDQSDPTTLDKGATFWQANGAALLAALSLASPRRRLALGQTSRLWPVWNDRNKSSADLRTYLEKQITDYLTSLADQRFGWPPAVKSTGPYLDFMPDPDSAPSSDLQSVIRQQLGDFAAQLIKLKQLIPPSIQEQPALAPNIPVEEVADMVPTTTAHAFNLHVDRFQALDEPPAGEDDDLMTHMAGIGVLLRQALAAPTDSTNPCAGAPWRMLNIAQLDIADPDNTDPDQVLPEVPAPARLTYRDAARQSLLTYDNDYLVARSALADVAVAKGFRDLFAWTLTVGGASGFFQLSLTAGSTIEVIQLNVNVPANAADGSKDSKASVENAINYLLKSASLPADASVTSTAGAGGTTVFTIVPSFTSSLPTLTAAPVTASSGVIARVAPTTSDTVTAPLRYDPVAATSVWGKLPSLKFGQMYEALPFIVGNSGALPPPLAPDHPIKLLPLASGSRLTTIPANAAGDVRRLLYLRRVPVGAPRLLPNTDLVTLADFFGILPISSITSAGLLPLPAGLLPLAKELGLHALSPALPNERFFFDTSARVGQLNLSAGQWTLTLPRVAATGTPYQPDTASGGQQTSWQIRFGLYVTDANGKITGQTTVMIQRKGPTLTPTLDSDTGPVAATPASFQLATSDGSNTPLTHGAIDLQLQLNGTALILGWRRSDWGEPWLTPFAAWTVSALKDPSRCFVQVSLGDDAAAPIPTFGIPTVSTPSSGGDLTPTIANEAIAVLRPRMLGSDPGDSMTFAIRPPAVDLRTWARWYDMNLYLGTDGATSDRRKQVWINYHTLLPVDGDGSSAGDLSFDDPAAAALLFELVPLLVDGEHPAATVPPLLFKLTPQRPQLMTVRGTLVIVQASPGTVGQFTLQSGGQPTATLTVGVSDVQAAVRKLPNMANATVKAFTTSDRTGRTVYRITPDNANGPLPILSGTSSSPLVTVLVQPGLPFVQTAPLLVKVTPWVWDPSSTAPPPHSLALDTNGNVTIQVAEQEIWQLRVYPAVLQTWFDNTKPAPGAQRFHSRFGACATPLRDAGKTDTAGDRVPFTDQKTGTSYYLFAPWRLTIEVATKQVLRLGPEEAPFTLNPPNADLSVAQALAWQAVTPSFDGRSVAVTFDKTAPALLSFPLPPPQPTAPVSLAANAVPPSLRRYRYVATIQLQRQIWRWRGRPVPPLPFEDAAYVPAASGTPMDPSQGPDRLPTVQAPSQVTDFVNDLNGLVQNLQVWDAPGFGDRSGIDLLGNTVNVGYATPTATLFTEDLTADPRALYYRFTALLFSRYAPLYPAAPPVVQTSGYDPHAFSATDANLGSVSPWRRLIVPCRWSGTVPRPVVRFIVPLTQPDDAVSSNEAARTPGLLVVLDETAFTTGGLAETIEADVVRVDDTYNGMSAVSRPEFGPDPTLRGRGWTQDATDKSGRFPPPDQAVAMNVTGPIGHTFDTTADAALYVASSYFLHPPPISATNNNNPTGDASLAWYFIKTRFRRLLVPEGQLGYLPLPDWADLTKPFPPLNLSADQDWVVSIAEITAATLASSNLRLTLHVDGNSQPPCVVTLTVAPPAGAAATGTLTLSVENPKATATLQCPPPPNGQSAVALDLRFVFQQDESTRPESAPQEQLHFTVSYRLRTPTDSTINVWQTLQSAAWPYDAWPTSLSAAVTGGIQLRAPRCSPARVSRFTTPYWLQFLANSRSLLPPAADTYQLTWSQQPATGANYQFKLSNSMGGSTASWNLGPQTLPGSTEGSDVIFFRVVLVTEVVRDVNGVVKPERYIGLYYLNTGGTLLTVQHRSPCLASQEEFTIPKLRLRVLELQSRKSIDYKLPRPDFWADLFGDPRNLDTQSAPDAVARIVGVSSPVTLPALRTQ